MKTIPLRIDEDLVNQAREAAYLADRTTTSQIKHWSRLGRILENVLGAGSVHEVKKRERLIDIENVVAFTQTAAGRDLALKEIKKNAARKRPITQKISHAK